MEESLTKRLFHAIETGFKCLYYIQTHTQMPIFSKNLKNWANFLKFSQS